MRDTVKWPHTVCTPSDWRQMAAQVEARNRFHRLFEAHGEQVLLYFKRRTDHESARDGAADTFLVAWRRIDEIPPESELPWLYGVARRVLSQQRRARSRRRRLVEKLRGGAHPEVPRPETIVVRNAEHVEVLSALKRLRRSDQELLGLAIWEELPHAAIAAMLGCSPHAVDQRLYRATKKLARELSSSGHRVHRKVLRISKAGEEAS